MKRLTLGQWLIRATASMGMVPVLLMTSCGSEAGSPIALEPRTVDPATPAEGVFLLASPIHRSPAAGLIQFVLYTPEPPPEQIQIQAARFVPIPVGSRDNVYLYAADLPSSLIPIQIPERLRLPDLRQARVEVLRSNGLTEWTSLIYQGDGDTVTFEDYVLVRATGDLPPSLRTAEAIATRANELFPEGEFAAPELDPVPDQFNTDYAAGGSVPPPDLEDAVVVYAATLLPPDLRTAANLAATASALLPDGSLDAADILFIPGEQLPPDGVPLTPPVSARPAGSIQISVEISPATLTTPSFLISGPDGTAEFLRLSSEIYPGFTTYTAAASSSLLPVEFSQVVIDQVMPEDCVIVHTPGTNPIPTANRIAASSADTCVAPVEFEDPNLEAAVRAAIAIPTAPILPADVESLTSLEATELGIVSLEGIQALSGLTELLLFNNQISDLGPLSSLEQLETLNLFGNQISDLSSLADLTQLVFLNLTFNQITDVTPLADLTTLELLGLARNQITDISPLADLTQLTQVLLNTNQISDISVLSGLEDLIFLGLEDNLVTNIQPLVDNPGLDSGDLVDLEVNPLDEISITTLIPELEARGVTVLQ